MKSVFRFEGDEFELYCLASTLLLCGGLAVLAQGQMDCLANDGILFVTVTTAIACAAAQHALTPATAGCNHQERPL